MSAVSELQRTECWPCFVNNGQVRDVKNLQSVCFSCAAGLAKHRSPAYAAQKAWDKAWHGESPCLICGTIDWCKMISFCPDCHARYEDRPEAIGRTAAPVATSSRPPLFLSEHHKEQTVCMSCSMFFKRCTVSVCDKCEIRYVDNPHEALKAYYAKADAAKSAAAAPDDAQDNDTDEPTRKRRRTADPE